MGIVISYNSHCNNSLQSQYNASRQNQTKRPKSPKPIRPTQWPALALPRRPPLRRSERHLRPSPRLPGPLPRLEIPDPQDEGRIRKFLNGAYGGKAQSGKPFMSPQEGVDLSLVEKEEFGKTPLLDDEDMDFYVQQFTKTGFEGPCNWYRTRRLNWEQDQNIPAATQNH